MKKFKFKKKILVDYINSEYKKIIDYITYEKIYKYLDKNRR